MRKLISMPTLPADGLRPELEALFDRLSIDPYPDLFVRRDGMLQSGPDPIGERVEAIEITRRKSE
jgi:hypothetical protein